MDYINLLFGVVLVIIGALFSSWFYTKPNFKWTIGNQKLIFAGLFTVLFGVILIIKSIF